MADLKISQLNSIVTVVPATDVLPVVQGGTTLKITPKQILESGSPAVLASATITGAATVGTTLGVTGDLTVDTNVLKVDTTNNRVGIGLASGMTAPLEVQSNTSGTSINMRGRSDNSGAMRFFANDGTTQQAYISADDTNIDILSVSTRPIRLSVNAVVVASALNGGNFSIANGNLVMSTSGKGIDFSAVTGGTGTATANVLNDYEEGTWTGTLNGSVSNPATLLSTTGKYTKIGRTVTAQVFFSNINTTGYSGRISISGLPFANGTVETVATAGFYGAATFTGSIFGLCTASGTAIVMYSSVSGSAFADVTFNPGSVQYIWANISYNV